MSENREKKEKMTAEARAAAAERLEEALGALPPRYFDAVFGAEAAAEEKKSAKKTRNRTAPAWLRPVAACLAVLLLGGLVVFSIPVVNNIISRRAPAELPGTDLAEADTTAEQEETEKPIETEAPVETEEIEVSQFEKKYSNYLSPSSRVKVSWIKERILLTASFNDLLKDERRSHVTTLEAAQKIVVGMPSNEVCDILGDECEYIYHNKYIWALDDGRVLEVRTKNYSKSEREEAYGTWIDGADFDKKQDDLLSHAPVISVEIYEDDALWEKTVKQAIINTALNYTEQGLMPDWYK